MLVEDAAGGASGASLAEVSPVAIEGRTFRRFLSQSAASGATFLVTLPRGIGAAPERRAWLVALLALGGIAMLLSLLRALRRPRRARAGKTPLPVEPETLAKRIVDLDVRFRRRRAPTGEELRAYDAERARLKAELTDALARRADGT